MMFKNQKTVFNQRFSIQVFTISLLIIGISAMALCGWIFDMPLLTSIWKTWVPIKPITAVGFIICGIALAIHSINSSNYILNLFSYILIGFLNLMAVLILYEYLFDISFGIDKIFIKNSAYPPLAAHPGRMPAIVAVNFLLIGVSLFFNRSKIILPAMLSMMVLLDTFLIILIYLYGSGSMLASQKYFDMAMLTAISFILTSLGILLSHPEGKIIRYLFGNLPGSILGRRLLLVAIIAPIALGFLRIVTHQTGLLDVTTGLALITIIYVILIIGIIAINVVTLNKEGLLNLNRSIEMDKMLLNSQQEVAK